jgi:hypothetical protein
MMEPAEAWLGDDGAAVVRWLDRSSERRIVVECAMGSLRSSSSNELPPDDACLGDLARLGSSTRPPGR